MSKKVYRTAIYTRLSRDDGDKEESNSITSQKAICMEYINSHKDLELVDVFVDDGYSGVSMNRPDFKRMEEAMRSGRIDAVICKDLSRIARNYIEGGRYIENIFPQLGVRFIAINDAYDSLTGDPRSDSFIIPFKNLINDTYCKDISMKIRSNLDVKRRQGEFVGAFTPYGYAKDPDNKNHLVIDEYAGGIVRMIFSLYKDGISIGGIADRLNSMGVLSPMEYKKSTGERYSTAFKTKARAVWSYTAVRRILTNEVYIGMLAQGKRGTPNYKVKIIQNRDENDWIRAEDTHDALISYDDFVSVKRMLGRDMRSASAKNQENVFSGFLYCGDCGAPMVRKVVPSKGRKYYYYVCSGNKKHEGCKSSHSISAASLVPVVTKALKIQIGHVLDISRTMDYIDSHSREKIAEFSYEAQIEAVNEEIEHCRRMKLRLYEDLVEGVIDKEDYSEYRNRYSSEIEEKEASVALLRKEQRDLKLDKETEKIWVSVFKENQSFEKLDHRVLMGLVDKILVYENKTIEVVFRYCDDIGRAREAVKRYAGTVCEDALGIVADPGREAV